MTALINKLQLSLCSTAYFMGQISSYTYQAEKFTFKEKRELLSVKLPISSFIINIFELRRISTFFNYIENLENVSNWVKSSLLSLNMLSEIETPFWEVRWEYTKVCPRCSDTFSISFVIFICIVMPISSLASRCSRGDSTSDYVIFIKKTRCFYCEKKCI